MQIQAISGMNFRSNNKNKIGNLSMQKVSKNQMKDTVSFGNIKQAATQISLNIVKEIFSAVEAIENNGEIKKETEIFHNEAINAAKKVQRNLSSIFEAELPYDEAKIGDLDNTKILAQNVYGRISFRQISNEGKFLKELDIEKDGFFRLNSFLYGESFVKKAAVGHVKEDKAYMVITRVEKFANNKILEKYSIRPVMNL